MVDVWPWLNRQHPGHARVGFMTGAGKGNRFGVPPTLLTVQDTNYITQEALDGAATPVPIFVANGGECRGAKLMHRIDIPQPGADGQIRLNPDDAGGGEGIRAGRHPPPDVPSALPGA